MGEVFWTALKLGLTSFGGPSAHLGYFERTFVRRLQWLTSEEYVQLVALCQTLPGPTSSQVGFLVGLRRAGWRGAVAAWALAGLNASVVGILGAALYDRVWRSGFHDPVDAVTVFAAFGLLQRWRLPAPAIAGLCRGVSLARKLVSL